MEKIYKSGILIIALLFAGSLFSTPAEASHFRYGTLSYTADGSGTVNFTLVAAFRRSGYSGSGSDGNPVTGDIITETIGGTGLSFGDGSSTGTLRFEVISYDVADNFIIGVALEPGTDNRGIPHTYSGAGPFEAEVNGCCRISDLNNRSNSSYQLITQVYPQVDNDSPTTSLDPIVRVNESDASYMFTVPATDSEGDDLRFRVATSSEAGGGSGTPTFSINSTTGEVTLDATQLTGFNTFYTEQVIIEELDGNGNVRTQTPIDFFIRPVEAIGTAPEVAISPSGPLTVAVGSPVSYAVEGTDADNDDITLNTSSALPSGASLSTALPQTGTPPVSTTFNWTPSSGQQGSYVFNFSVEDETGLQDQESITVNVVLPGCPSGLAIADEARFSASDDYQVAPDGQEYVDITNTSGTTVSLGGCTLAFFDAMNETSYYASSLSATLDPGETYRAGNPGVSNTDETFSSGTLDDGPGGIAVLDRTSVANGTSVVDAAGDVVTSVVYLPGGNIFLKLPSTSGSGATMARMAKGDELNFAEALREARAYASGESHRPEAFRLEAGYPNPFAQQTTISFALPEAAEVRLAIYDALGRKVRQLVASRHEAGQHQVIWDGKNASGQAVSNGMYFYRIEAGSFAATKHLLRVQ